MGYYIFWSRSWNIHVGSNSIRAEYQLNQNFPKPFNPITTVRYELPEDSFVDVTVYDMLSNVVNNLVNTNQLSNYKSIQWDATSNLGEPVSAGVYIQDSGR